MAYSPKGYLLSQSKYVSDIITRAGLSNTCIVDTSIELNCKLSLSDDELLADPTRYKKVVGSLVYLTIIGPDISYVVYVVS